MGRLVRVLVLGGLLAVLPAAGQEIALSVEQAVSQALARDPTVASAAHQAGAAEAALAGRRLARLPGLALAGSYSRLNELEPSPLTGTAPPADAYGLSVDLRQPLFSGGRLSQQVRAAGFEAQAAAGDLEAARLGLRLRVVRTYWQLARHTAALAALGQRHGQVRELLREVESRVDQGLATRQELLRLRSVEADTELRVARSRSEQELAAAELALLVGLPPGARVTAVSAPPQDLPVLPAEQALRARAEQSHPQLRAALLRVEGARSAERAAGAGMLPTLGLSALFGYQSPDPRAFPPQEELASQWRLGASLGFDLLSPVRVPVERREAAERRQAAAERARAIQDQLLLDLKRAYAEASLAEREARAAEAAGLYAAELRRGAQDRYDQGAALRSELLDAQALLLEAELRLIDARVNRLVSRAALAAAAGEASREAWVEASGFGSAQQGESP